MPAETAQRAAVLRAKTTEAATHLAALLSQTADAIERSGRLAEDQSRRESERGRLEAAAEEHRIAERAYVEAERARGRAQKWLAVLREEWATTTVRAADHGRGSVTRERRERDRLLLERELIAVERDQIAAEREQITLERQMAPSAVGRGPHVRGQVGSGAVMQRLEQRERTAHERDRLADEREAIANDRERIADERERAADERERLMDELAGRAQSEGAARRERTERRAARRQSAARRRAAAVAREVDAGERTSARVRRSE